MTEGVTGDDAGWEQRQLVGLALDNEGVPSVVAALKPHHHVRPACQPIDNLTLAFVTPLGADDGDVRH